VKGETVVKNGFHGPGERLMDRGRASLWSLGVWVWCLRQSCRAVFCESRTFDRSEIEGFLREI